MKVKAQKKRVTASAVTLLMSFYCSVSLFGNRKSAVSKVQEKVLISSTTQSGAYATGGSDGVLVDVGDLGE